MNMCELFEKYDSDLIEQGRKLGLDEGKKLGLDEKASSIARNLIAMSMPEDDIAKVTGLSLEEVQALIAS